MVKFKLPVILAARSGLGTDQSHAADACGASCGGIAGARRGVDRRPEPREPRNDREIWPRPRYRRNSQAAQPPPHRADAGVPESLRPIRFCAIIARMNSALRIWHPFTNGALDPAPLLVARAEGVYLYTADGRKILDAISSWWVNLHGHANPRIAAADRGTGAKAGARHPGGIHARGRGRIGRAFAEMAAARADAHVFFG